MDPYGLFRNWQTTLEQEQNNIFQFFGGNEIDQQQQQYDTNTYNQTKNFNSSDYQNQNITVPLNPNNNTQPQNQMNSTQTYNDNYNNTQLENKKNNSQNNQTQQSNENTNQNKTQQFLTINYDYIQHYDKKQNNESIKNKNSYIEYQYFQLELCEKYIQPQLDNKCQGLP
ncbi:hypothetical protein PPERSA_07857 [Pseudocohnilembus persalinus]|uniref:Uncharacterized protein n=1 Tax=Pseudocohnilembus persalinus TaxID=266149 RepID=A0A0V0QCJ9_PSEPJ|nr:hypothetical protein PPERSA_07857 [Pseudocohnilembus persalinus]|eukprot:KRW99780.1 hypothetical protein PPERSA_07857 [Pseudocohnilembus persalinus]